MKWDSRSEAEWIAAIVRSDSTALSRTTVSSTVARPSRGAYHQNTHGYHHHTTTALRPFFRDHPGEPVPGENFWTSLLRLRGRHTNHLAGHHSIRTNQCSPPPSHLFYRPTCQSTEGNWLILKRHFISFTTSSQWGDFSVKVFVIWIITITSYELYHPLCSTHYWHSHENAPGGI